MDRWWANLDARNAVKRQALVLCATLGLLLFVVEQGAGSQPCVYKQISARGSHSCGLLTDGTAVCHGKCENALAAAPADAFVAISTGFSHACGLRSDGTVTCWGFSGACGLEADVIFAGEPCWTEPAAPLPNPAGAFAAISAGHSYTCGLRPNGEIDCWGTVPRYSDLVPPGGEFAALSAGDHHACGIRVDGQIVCWGNNDQGQTSAPVGAFAQVSAGATHTCARRVDGTVVCWGRNTFGELNAPLGEFVAISAARDHTCGLRADDHVECWGFFQNATSQVPLPAGPFRSLTSGTRSNFTCGLRYDGSFSCWGTEEPAVLTDSIPWEKYGVCGDGEIDRRDSLVSGRYQRESSVRGAGEECDDGNTIDGDCCSKTCTIERSPVSCDPSAGSCRFRTISPGNAGNCGLKTDGSLVCWDNFYGDGDDAFSQKISDVFTKLSSAGEMFCGLRTTGEVRCWNESGYEGWSVPTGVFTDVAVGNNDGHACGIRDNGLVACWGDNSHGQANPPPGIFTSLEAGTRRTCGLHENGEIECWGGDSLVPDPPHGTFSQVAVGDLATCGLRVDGSVECTGPENFFSGDVRPPLGPFSAIAGGKSTPTFCATRPNGDVVCWGGGLQCRNWDVLFPPSGAFSRIAGSGSQFCGVRPSGVGECWGTNGSLVELNSVPLLCDRCGTGGVAQSIPCDDGNFVSADGCDENCFVEQVGNGNRQVGEECDDGNANSHDGCNGHGQVDCPDRLSLTCSPATFAQLQIRTSDDSSRNRLRWTWRGDAIDLADPTSTARYDLCLYPDGKYGGEALVPGHSGWRSDSGSNYSYADKTAANGGVSKIKLKSGSSSSIKVRAKGANLSSSLLPATSYTVQLVHTQSGRCWEAQFNEGSISAQRFEGEQ